MTKADAQQLIFTYRQALAQLEYTRQKATHYMYNQQRAGLGIKKPPQNIEQNYKIALDAVVATERILMEYLTGERE